MSPGPAGNSNNTCLRHAHAPCSRFLSPLRPVWSVHAGHSAKPKPVTCDSRISSLPSLVPAGRWPDDATAFRKMKAALGLQLASSLSSSYGHHVSASEEAVDVLLDGFAFRLVLYSGRDEAMLERMAVAAASGASGAAAATAAAAAAATPALAAAATAALAAAGGSAASVGVGAGLLSPEESPLLLTWHHGLISQVAGANASYAPAARLAGRWVAAHMMSNHVSPQAVELLVAAAFGGAGVPVGPPPGSRITGEYAQLPLGS